jgi:protein TonB
MSTIALHLPKGAGIRWRSMGRGGLVNGRRIAAIAAVCILHLWLLGQLLLPKSALYMPLQTLRTPEEILIEPIEPPPPPIRPPEPPAPIVPRDTPPPRLLDPVVTPPVAPVVTPPATAHTESSNEPPAVVQPYSPPADTPARQPQLQALTVLRAPPPVYSTRDQRLGRGGTVRLRILVGIDGRAAEVLIDQSSGHASLDAAARKVVERSWRFAPSTRDGQAIARWGVVNISFKPGI